MSLNQMEDFTFKHSSQIDAIYTEYTGQQIRGLFDTRGVELRNALNLLITTLKSTEGASDIGTSTIQDVDGANIQAMLQSIRDKLKAKTDGLSGADYVGATAISGLSGETVQSVLESLKNYTDSLTAENIEATPIASGSGSTVQAQLAWLLSQIVIATTGSIIDGSIGEIKLSPALLDKINLALSNEGLLSLLLSADKSSLVNAINETLIIPVAGGTSTAITLSLPTLIDRYTKTFIASASNSGSATTINGKPLYKPNTFIAPNLILGKAYTVWYNSTSNCFFIKASAEGTAGVGDVLAGTTFSNDSDTGLLGTLTLTGNAGDTQVLSGQTYYNTDAKTKRTGTMANNGAVAITPSTINQTIANGFHNGSGYILGDTDLIASNIKSGVSIFGVAGNVEPIKRSASGTGTASSNVLTVTGLTFTPSKFFITGDINGVPGAMFFDSSVQTGGAYWGATNNGSGGYRGAGVTTNGFYADVNYATTCNWTAYE